MSDAARTTDTSPSIAFIGAGPTAIYTLCGLLAAAQDRAAITIYENQPRAGLGTPYRPGWNDPAMLSNISSIEIPEIEETLVEWLGAQPRARLIRLGIDPEAIDERAFYPRVALGEYFLDQFNGLIGRARERGFEVEIATSHRVTDIRAEENGLRLFIEPASGAPFERSFDQVVLATGHQWPEEPELRPGYFASPWPATALQRITAVPVGIRGSSLTAIDAVVAIASAHGNLVETDGACIDYHTYPGSEGLKLVMLSRKGLLPEADFYHPIPYEPLSIFTDDAIAGLIAQHCEDVLDRSFGLFKEELAAADPDYAQRVGLAGLALEDFADAYFAERISADAFEWAEANLAEARANFESKTVVPWRYAILRMHEVVAAIVPQLGNEALARFNRYWKPIFVDDYATVPHLSIERLLALHRAGRLEVMALGSDYRIDTHGDEPGAAVIFDGKRQQFPAFVDATGQRALVVDAFPFDGLLEQGVVQDVSALDGAGEKEKGVAVDEAFHPISEHQAAERLYCLSIPFILERHPFIQGITSSHAMGHAVGAELAGAIGGGRDDGADRLPAERVGTK